MGGRKSRFTDVQPNSNLTVLEVYRKPNQTGTILVDANYGKGNVI